MKSLFPIPSPALGVPSGPVTGHRAEISACPCAAPRERAAARSELVSRSPPGWAGQVPSVALAVPEGRHRAEGRCHRPGARRGRAVHRAALGWPWLTLISCYPCARYRPPPLAVPLAAGLTRELESWVDPRGTRDGKGQIHSRSCLCRAGVSCLMLQEPEKVRWVSKARGEPPAWGKRAQVMSALTQRWPKYRGKPRNRHTICS